MNASTERLWDDRSNRWRLIVAFGLILIMVTYGVIKLTEDPYRTIVTDEIFTCPEEPPPMRSITTWSDWDRPDSSNNPYFIFTWRTGDIVDSLPPTATFDLAICSLYVKNSWEEK